MTESRPDEIRARVRDRYGEIARKGAAGGGCAPAQGGSCCGGEPQEIRPVATQRLGYSTAELGSAPAESDLGLGCGNPQAIAALRPGETVLDLGSGAGLDCFLAAKQVGPTGRVIGVDMTADMVAKARENARRAGAANVEFRLGEIEHLPVADASVDVIISNCVVNLSPDKPAVWREALRVLRPGGRLAVSDVVASAPLPREVRDDPDLQCACVGGAATIDEVACQLAEAGFAGVRVTQREESRTFIKDWAPGSGIEAFVVSAAIEAVKPAEPGRPRGCDCLPVREVVAADRPAIAALLTSAGLPVPGPEDGPVGLLVAATDDDVIGCVGWEMHGSRALLRSLAVRPTWRGGGAGRALVATLHARLAAAGVHEAYLLTTSAAPWFARHGYAPIERADVPAEVRESREFTLDCCRKAACMKREL